jgi:hypothetical protein
MQKMMPPTTTSAPVRSRIENVSGCLLHAPQRVCVALSGLTSRVTSLENSLDARMETLDRDLRDWAKITMQQNSEIARLKDKVGLA